MHNSETPDLEPKPDDSIPTIDMATAKNYRPTEKSDGIASDQQQNNRTWFPILLGVFCGMVIFVLLAMLESPAFYRLTVLVFNETSPKALFAMPGYYCVHRAVLFILAGTGGLVGVFYSRWRKRTSLLFLLATLVVITVFAFSGFH